MIHYYLRTVDDHFLRTTEKALRLGYVQAIITARNDLISPEFPIFLPDTSSKVLRLLLKWIDWYESNGSSEKLHEPQCITDWEISLFDSLDHCTRAELLLSAESLMVPELWESLAKYMGTKGK